MDHVTASIETKKLKSRFMTSHYVTKVRNPIASISLVPNEFHFVRDFILNFDWPNFGSGRDVISSVPNQSAPYAAASRRPLHYVMGPAIESDSDTGPAGLTLSHDGGHAGGVVKKM